jgi:hypothetical protein
VNVLKPHLRITIETLLGTGTTQREIASGVLARGRIARLELLLVAAGNRGYLSRGD